MIACTGEFPLATQTLSYVDAITHLPPGGTLILSDVPWEEYEQLLADLGDSYAARITYDRGRLEIMSPSIRHENFAETIARLLHVLAEELDVQLESLGSTTYKQEWRERGVEPDACFYVENATRIIGKRKIDLSTDPPPDIAVEIDLSGESTSKLAIYAGMGVPEVWRYDRQRVWIYHLIDQDYAEASSSRAFPLLTAAVLSQFLEQSKSEGQTATLGAFRKWLRAQRSQGSTESSAKN